MNPEPSSSVQSTPRTAGLKVRPVKLAKGQTLAAILEDRADAREDRPRLLGIALKIAWTLAYAHAKRVIHQDL